MQESHSIKEFKSEQQQQHLTEEIISRKNVKFEESHHSSQIESQMFSIMSPHKENLPLNDRFISDFSIRPSIDSYHSSIRADSIRDVDEFYSSRDSSHSHLYQIMKEIREKEAIYNKKHTKELESQSINQTEYSDANSNLKTIFHEILLNNTSKQKSTLNSTPKSTSLSSNSSSLDKVFIDQKDKQSLNEVVSEMMTTDLNKYSGQSPYLNGIMSEALAQNKKNNIKSSLDTYSSYYDSKNKSFYNTAASFHEEEHQQAPFYVNTDSSNITRESFDQKKRITNGVAVLPVNFGSLKKTSVTSSDNQYTENSSNLVNVMKEVILSNNEVVSSGFDESNQNKLAAEGFSQTKSGSKRIEDVLPVIVESKSQASNKIIRQVAFEEITSSNSSNSTTTKKIIENKAASNLHFNSESISRPNTGEKHQNAEKVLIVSPNEQRKEIQNALPIGEDRGFGLVRLTVHYDELRSRFSVTVHEAR